MRVIVHTGKGGVGKTSISAATALRCAEMGLKTLVISTDTAHSLADSLEREVGPEPTELTTNLWAQEIDTRYSMDKYWGKIQTYLSAIFSRQGATDIVAEEVTIIPGLEEGASLLWINEYFKKGEYDVLIVDAAPTAETIRLLSLPDVTRWWLERIMRLTRGFKSVVDTVKGVRNAFRRNEKDELEKVVDDGDAWDQVVALFDMLEDVRELLTNPEVASMRLVVNPEKMVIKETQRTYTYLNLYGYATDAILVNRVIPDEVKDPYFANWKKRQRENLVFVKEAFGQLPMLQAPLFGEEMGGLEGLRKLADALYGDQNPAERMFDGVVHEIIKVEDENDPDAYILRVPVGFAEKRDVDLYRSSDEITLRVGPYRRNIILPPALHNLEIADAKLAASNLNIRFSKPAPSNGKK
ncbi:ArsA family ATPase [Phototrophicus methaneseepsis]|uniref:arsenite-transporting ATPase n=1 Tax=Phototrophicus methaneseepsis TaxID=2710758 RepID=A0A7S8E895_9CHLR|nr:ArsA family ATPase [Phototrophicus methaneseepsis]QPC82177.1 ArsA family ATPase [Phototrophicus methaneseepsis]